MASARSDSCVGRVPNEPNIADMLPQGFAARTGGHMQQQLRAMAKEPGVANKRGVTNNELLEACEKSQALLGFSRVQAASSSDVCVGRVPNEPNIAYM